MTEERLDPLPDRRSPIIWGVIAVVVVIALVVALWGVRRVVLACGGVSSGISKVDGECIGVSGDYSFDDKYDDIMGRIASANREIGDSRAVSVAVLGSFTTDATSAVSKAEMRRQLVGAYVAQQSFNRGKGENSTRLKILVANEGSHQQHWPRVVEDLLERRGDRAPLIAVTGLGVSVAETADAARRLSAERVPMVGSITTADMLSGIKGFFRVSPPNREYVAALRARVDATPSFSSAVLVRDDTPAENDLFTANLADDMVAEFGKEIGKRPPITFDGSNNPNSSEPLNFGLAAAQVCDDDARVLLFAGRSIDLPELLSKLSDKCAADRRITVMTGGSDDLGGFGSTISKLPHQNIDLVYASGTDPENWLRGQAAPEGFQTFLNVYHDLDFGDDELSDGAVLTAFDSMRTVTTGLEVLLEESGAVANAAQLGRTMENLNRLARVHGATGDFSFQSREPHTGDPIGKPVPIVSIPPQKGPKGARIYLTDAKFIYR
jgi:hypothetical protein